MACDICGAKGTTLTDLLDAYATAEIKQICPECEKVVNKQMWKLRAVIGNILSYWLRRFMEQRRANG